MDTTNQTNRSPLTDLVAKQRKLPPKQLSLTPADASATYGISKRALKRAWSERRLPYYKLGHRTVILDARDIEAFLAKCRVDALHN
jgi:hypothetical protein